MDEFLKNDYLLNDDSETEEEFESSNEGTEKELLSDDAELEELEKEEFYSPNDDPSSEEV